jgi:hypothetical protein
MGTTYSFNTLPSATYKSIVKAPIVEPIIRLTLLRENENFAEDITSYVEREGGSLNINYQQGQRRSLSFTLKNEDGRFLPDIDRLWLNTKFKLELGIRFNKDDYVYNAAGVFVVSNPEATRSGAQKTIAIQCEDKFALLDGTLGGTLEGTYTVSQGANMRNEIQKILMQDNGNGYPLDSKPFIFDAMYSDATVVNDLSLNVGDSFGTAIIDLANSIACDVWYGVDGNLIFRSGTQDVTKLSEPTLWEYSDTETEYLDNTTTYNFTDVKNKIVVIGNNISDDLYYNGTAINNNPQSSTRVQLIGNRVKSITDSNISNDADCLSRAQYELVKASIMANTISFNSTYMIHLDVNNCITLADSYYGYFMDRFVIQSLTIPFGANSKISVSCCNVRTLPYYTDS